MIRFAPDAVRAKDPDDTDFYYMDWSQELNDGETISASTWVVQSGLTIDDEDTILAGAYKTRVTLSGGLTQNNYDCTNRITTSASRNLSMTGVVRVRER